MYFTIYSIIIKYIQVYPYSNHTEVTNRGHNFQNGDKKKSEN